LSYILRGQFKTHQIFRFLVCGIDKIGMHSMVIEADMAGNYVGSSYGWATTRDWSKFGCCTCTKETGMEQILEESWVKYVELLQRQRWGSFG
jgi:hypothetical protein